MLFKQIHLKGIRSGTISLAFRKWKRPSVKKGSQIKTAAGVIKITDIQEDITLNDAKNAGFKRLEDLLKMFEKVSEGKLYRIAVQYHSPDPRILLREQTELSEEAFGRLQAKLERLDRFSKQGAWTLSILKAIEKHPKLRAAELATKTGREKDWLKLNVRKLKNLGLTVSHHPGYTLSPLGKIFLKKVIR